VRELRDRRDGGRLIATRRHLWRLLGRAIDFFSPASALGSIVVGLRPNQPELVLDRRGGGTTEQATLSVRVVWYCPSASAASIMAASAASLIRERRDLKRSVDKFETPAEFETCAAPADLPLTDLTRL